MRLFKNLLLLTILLSLGCAPEEINPPLCPDNDCNGRLFLPYPQDSNGIYRVDLDFDGEYLPRFDIFIEADDVDPFYYYNDIGVVQAAFQSPSTWTLPNSEVLEIVQSTTIYLNNSPSNTEYTPTIDGRKWGKRIVGPIPSSYEGEILTIDAEIYWDGGSKYHSQYFQIKILIE